MSLFAINKNPSGVELRNFGWAMLLGFTGIGLFLWLSPWFSAWRRGIPCPSLAWEGFPLQWTALGLIFLGVVIFGISHAAPPLAKRIYLAWMTVTFPIGVAMTTIILTMLFFLLLPPFSLIVRRKDPLRRRLKKNGTYWEDYKAHEPTLERMRRLF